eukprot:6199223-Pyramimonas_sp.AAC.1
MVNESTALLLQLGDDGDARATMAARAQTMAERWQNFLQQYCDFKRLSRSMAATSVITAVAA